MSGFNPNLRNTQGNTWEASIELPVVGRVTVSGNGWQDAKLKLWLVSEAVRLMDSRAKKLKPPSDWGDDKWRSTLKTMSEVMSPNESKTP